MSRLYKTLFKISSFTTNDQKRVTIVNDAMAISWRPQVSKYTPSFKIEFGNCRNTSFVVSSSENDEASIMSHHWKYGELLSFSGWKWSKKFEKLKKITKMKTPSTEREFVDRNPFVRTCIEKLASCPTILVKRASDCENFGLINTS